MLAIAAAPVTAESFLKKSDLIVRYQAMRLPNTVVWQTKAPVVSDVAASMEKLYLSLYNTGRLPWRYLDENTGRRVEKILEDEELFFGSYFRIKARNLLKANVRYAQSGEQSFKPYCEVKPNWWIEQRHILH